MNKIRTVMAGVMLTATVTSAQAGGIITNTNQSIDFLRNPARDAAIGLDGVYSNPAGVAFMPEGFHFGFNWQYARQTRTITSTNPVFQYGAKNNNQTTKTFEGTADAPFIPSIQAAYNKGDWSLQFNFSVPGGGGACEFADGLGSFESVVGTIAKQLEPFGSKGYDMNGYMQGRQYYFGFQLGSAYKISDHLSVYGGLRVLYGTATYKAKISNIMVKVGENTYTNFGSFLQSAATAVDNNLGLINDGMQRYEAAGATALPEYAVLVQQKAQLEDAKGSFGTLQKYSQGVNLLCNQSSVGVAPVLGVDYKLNDQFNFAVKYEFKTQIRMKNESTVFEASEIDAVNKFKDEEKVNEDAPALLTVGAQWSPITDVRVNVGGHYYFDKEADWYGNAQEKLDHNTYEILAGGEWDITDKLTVSAGGQLTRYGLTDDYMNDMSFVVNSYSVGFGFNYKATDHLTLKAGYFQTIYDTYDRVTSKEPLVSDSFTRTNRVLGIGCQVDL